MLQLHHILFYLTFLSGFNTFLVNSTSNTAAPSATPVATSTAAADDDDSAVPGPKVLAHVKLAKTITRKHLSQLVHPLY